MAPPASGRGRAAAIALVACALLPLAGGCDRVRARQQAREGNALYRAGKLAAARDAFEAAVRLEPKLAVAWLHLGYANLALASEARGEAADRARRRAREAFARFMALRPADPRGPRYYLQALLDEGRYDEALRFLKRRLSKRPRDVALMATLGAVASRAGRLDEALRWYRRRAALLPGAVEPRYQIGTAVWERLHDHPEIAGSARVALANIGIAALEEALAIQADHLPSLTYLNLLYRERALGQTDPAARARDLARARALHQRALARARAAR